MLHYVHQLVANSVFLLFGAEQGEYKGFLELFLLITAVCCARKWPYERGDGETNHKVVCRKAIFISSFDTLAIIQSSGICFINFTFCLVL